MPNLFKQLFWFVLVGTTSALVHWTVVVLLVSQMNLAPLTANLFGWLVAFVFSFSGHFLLTFKQHNALLWSAVRRFFLISATGFLINETAYAILLKTTDFNYQWLLAVVLVGVAFLTFLISKFWAFAPKRHA